MNTKILSAFNLVLWSPFTNSIDDFTIKKYQYLFECAANNEILYNYLQKMDDIHKEFFINDMTNRTNYEKMFTKAATLLEQFISEYI